MDSIFLCKTLRKPRVFGSFLRRSRRKKIFDLKMKIALTNPLEIYMIGLTRIARKIGKRGGG